MLKTYFAVGASVLLLACTAFAQQTATPMGAPAAAPPAATRPGPAPLAIPNPHYVSIPMTIDVNAPVDKVWARIGKFCDIGEWQGRGGANTCTILSGTDGDFGAVRSVASEVLVGKTKYSYTYGQAPRTGVPYNLYHGTLEAVPLTATTTRLNYTLFFDNSMLADDAARATDLESRRASFTRYLGNMKILAEGGTLPTPAPRPAGAAAGAPAGAPNSPRPAQAPLMSPIPHYVSIPMTVNVNASVDKVWARIGKYCDIGEWGIPGCTIISGTDGEFGVVRSIGNEVLVGKTQYSYIYTQPLRVTGGYIMYHGTLEARALTPTTTQLIYTLLYDNSSLADDAARETDMNNRRTRFTSMLTNMKTLSEGGTLPPGALGRGPGAGTPPAPPGR
jgi:Polyketide cyclase / dehydrase and lipid transport